MIFVVVILALLIISTADESNFFNESGLSFLRQYGSAYNLVDQFYGNSLSSLRTPNISNVNKTIESLYSTRITRDYKFYGSGFLEWSSFQIAKNATESDTYNHRFKVGPLSEDRFFSIFLHGDPWSSQSFSTLDDISVNFVGASEGLESDMTFEGFSCRFNFPLRLPTPVKFEVLRKDSNKVLYRQMNSKKSRIFRCLLPRDLLDFLRQSNSSSFIDVAEEQQLIRFDLLKDGVTVLGNVTVARLHAMDRRHFQVSVSSMTSRPADPLLLEWLCFWLLAGVEHFFYLFDNSPLPRQGQDPWWLLRPFMSAELVTLLPFHFQLHRHWDAVQAAAAQITLQQFGSLLITTSLAASYFDDLLTPSLLAPRPPERVDRLLRPGRVSVAFSPAAVLPQQFLLRQQLQIPL
jgi:hypothetical protein